jgi:hypothetical protein
MSALRKELGTVYFLRQFEVGTGSYIEEQEQLLVGTTLDEIVNDIRNDIW